MTMYTEPHRREVVEHRIVVKEPQAQQLVAELQWLFDNYPGDMRNLFTALKELRKALGARNL